MQTFAESDLTLTVETARRAVRHFLLRRYQTKGGLFLFLGPVAVFVLLVPIWIRYYGFDWFVGIFGTMLGLSLVLQATSFYSMPRAMIRNIAKLQPPRAHVLLTDDKLALSIGDHVVNIPWERIRHISFQEDFALLSLSYFIMIHLPTNGMSETVREELQRRATALGA